MDSCDEQKGSEGAGITHDEAGAVRSVSRRVLAFRRGCTTHQLLQLGLATAVLAKMRYLAAAETCQFRGTSSPLLSLVTYRDALTPSNEVAWESAWYQRDPLNKILVKAPQKRETTTAHLN